MNAEDIVAIVEGVHPGIEDLGARTDLDDILDSFDIMQIVEELEERLGTEIDPDDIVPENFASVESLARLARGTSA